MNVKDLNVEDRPRERLLKHGPRVLSDAELLAILIGSGTRDSHVFDIAHAILHTYTLTQLKELSYEKLIKIRGIKQAKACQLLTCFEIARRSSKRTIAKASLESPKDIYDYVYNQIYLESHEILIAILCDCKLHPIKMLIERSDSTHQVGFPAKKILTKALEFEAYAIILVHNHPSGEVTPSKADIMTTLEFQHILIPLDIILLDHLVASPSEYYSMNEHGLLSSFDEYSILGEANEKITL